MENYKSLYEVGIKESDSSKKSYFVSKSRAKGFYNRLVSKLGAVSCKDVFEDVMDSKEYDKGVIYIKYLGLLNSEFK